MLVAANAGDVHMMQVFFKRFYILLFLVWLLAVAGLFTLSVWGNWGTFFSDISALHPGQMFEGVPLADKDGAKVEEADKKIRSRIELVLQQAENTIVSDFNRLFGREEAEQTHVTQQQGKVHEVRSEVETKQRKTSQTQSGNERPGGGILQAVTFSKPKGRLVAHLRTEGKVGKITVFWLNHPTRLAVDLRGKWDNKTSRIYRFADGFVDRVVIGLHKDRLRVVFNFTNTAAKMGERPELQYTSDGVNIVVDNPDGG